MLRNLLAIVRTYFLSIFSGCLGLSLLFAAGLLALAAFVPDLAAAGIPFWGWAGGLALAGAATSLVGIWLAGRKARKLTAGGEDDR